MSSMRVRACGLVMLCTLLGCASSHVGGDHPAVYHDSCVAWFEIYCAAAPRDERPGCRANIAMDCADPDWPCPPTPTVDQVDECLAATRRHPIPIDLLDTPPECDGVFVCFTPLVPADAGP